MMEFHCLLVRADVLRRLGPFDEGLKSALENPDFCMSVRQAGGDIYFEPAALVTYLPPPPLAWSDLRYFLLRWSDAWNRASLDHFRDKWRLAEDDPGLAKQFKEWTWWRRQGLLPPSSILARLLRTRAGFSLAHRLAQAEGRLNRWLVRGRRGSRGD
jgi:hypothetical protein